MIHSPLFIATLAHLSKFLGIANKFIPIYKDIKPVAQNIPKYLDKLANLSERFRKNGSNYISNINRPSEHDKVINQPKFFQ